MPSKCACVTLTLGVAGGWLEGVQGLAAARREGTSLLNHGTRCWLTVFGFRTSGNTYFCPSVEEECTNTCGLEELPTALPHHEARQGTDPENLRRK